MDLEEPDEGTTVLKLRQTGVPEFDRFGNEMREVERQVPPIHWEEKSILRKESTCMLF